MGVHGIVEDMNKLQMGELPEEELRALEADLTGKVNILCLASACPSLTCELVAHGVCCPVCFT